MTSLGPFSLDHPLAHGGMGEVWQATHASGEVVAIKVLKERDARAARALAHEIRAVAGLDHPHIVWVHDHGEVDGAAAHASRGRLVAGSPWLAMELCDAGDLRRRARTLDWLAARDTLISLLDALAHAHARGVVHRDLKPSNVLYRREPGRAPVLALVDFGLAVALETGHAAIERAGSPSWMAPEQLQADSAAIGPWTDLYALGAIGWALVTGESPNRGTRGGVRRPSIPFSPRIAVPDGLEDWLRSLLEDDPWARPQRAADAAWALSQLGGVPTSDPGPRPQVPALHAAETRRLGDSTPVSDLTTALWLPDLDGAPRPRPAPAPELVAPPTPPDWRRPSPRLRPLEQVGSGLGLFGLRTLPVVGRAVEQDQLWQTLRATVADGEVRCVILEGPAGVGKSHLAEWLLRRGHEVGATASFVATHSPEGAAGDGLAGLVARTLRVVGRDADEARARALQTVPEALSSELEPLLSLVAEGASPPGTAERVLRLVRHRARGRVALLWLDDVQWGTEALSLARALLTGGAAPFPALLVLTVRTDTVQNVGLEEALRGLSHPDARRLPVGPLARPHRAELVRTLLRLEPVLAGAVEERSGGHPLFAVQLVTGWVERGELVAGPAGLALRAGADASLPESVGALWRARLAPVLAADPRARDGLEIAAVLGQEVDATEWVEACRIAQVPVPGRLPVQLAVRRLAAYDPAASGLRWRFVHGMLREALLADAEAAGRAPRWHAACAEVVQRRGGAPDRVGLHLLAAGRPAEALEPLERACQAADRAGAWSRDLWLNSRRLEAALALESPLPAVVSRIRLDTAWSLKNLGRLEEAEAEARDVLQGARAAADGVSEASALDTLAAVLTERGDLQGAIATAEAAAQAARLVGDDIVVVRALSRLGPALGKAGLVARARPVYEEILARTPPGEANAGTRGAGWFGVAMCAQHEGDDVAAVRAARAGRAEAVDLGWSLMVGDFDRLLGFVAASAGDWPEAELRYRLSTEAYEAGGSPYRAMSYAGLARCAAQRGDLDAAEQGFQRSLDLAREQHRPGWLQAALTGLVDVASRSARWSRLATLLDEVDAGMGEEVSRGEATALVDAGDRAASAGRAALAATAWRLAVRMLERAGEDESPVHRRLAASAPD